MKGQIKIPLSLFYTFNNALGTFTLVETHTSKTVWSFCSIRANWHEIQLAQRVKALKEIHRKAKP